MGYHRHHHHHCHGLLDWPHRHHRHHHHHGWHHRHHHHHGLASSLTEVACLAAGAAAVSAVVAKRAPPMAPCAWTPVAPVAPVAVPLGVSAVGIPACGLSKQGGVTYFTVEVVPEQGATYQVQKRYRDFYALKDRLHCFGNINQDFPRKHLTGCEGVRLEERRHGLERWLTRMLNDAHVKSFYSMELRSFLEVGGVHTLPVEPVPPAACMPQASAPSEGEVLQIQVPPGVVTGQAVAVTVPDGRQVNFLLPPGVVGGQQLNLWFDPAACSLNPLL